MTTETGERPVTTRSRTNQQRQQWRDAVCRRREVAMRKCRDGAPAPLNRDLACLERAWKELAEKLPRVAAALDLHYFGRCGVQEVAMTLGRSLDTSALALRFGQAWLARSLKRISK